MRPIVGGPPLWLALCLVAGCSDQDVQYRERVPSALTAGMAVPRYAAMTLAGDTVRLEELQGQVVLLNAWATWCDPCVIELPVLQQLHERFEAEGLRVLGVSIDRDQPVEIQRFLDSHGVTYPSLKDRGWDLTRTFGWGPGVPKSLLIDREGKVALFWSGGVHPKNDAHISFLRDTIAVLLRN